MLALTPTPDESWPPLPKTGLCEAGMGVFSMLRGKLNPPLSKSLHSVHTCALARLPPSFDTIAAVQFPGVHGIAEPFAMYAFVLPAFCDNAASKNGWAVTAAAFAAQPPPAIPAIPPQYCNTTFL